MNIPLRLFFVCIFFAISCVEPYSIDFNQSFNVLLIEAELNNEDRTQRINIYYSQNEKQSLSKEPLKGLKVEVEVNGSLRLQLMETEGGWYNFPEKFRPKVGDSFQLFFQKTDGRQYRSSIETLFASVEIDKIYDNFQTSGGKAFGRNVPANYIYLDFQDTNLSNDYYHWTWKLWEKQSICFSNDFYDLYCERPCYEILENENIEIFDNKFYNGKTISKRLVAMIPYYQSSGALLELKQYVISQDAYKFYKQLQDLTESNGTLADTPPQIIGGNIACITDEREYIVGMFMVKGVTTKYYWLDRKNAHSNIQPIGLLGRDPRPPKGGGNLTTPCNLLENRTPVKPRNWID